MHRMEGRTARHSVSLACTRFSRHRYCQPAPHYNEAAVGKRSPPLTPKVWSPAPTLPADQIYLPGRTGSSPSLRSLGAFCHAGCRIPRQFAGNTRHALRRQPAAPWAGVRQRWTEADSEVWTAMCWERMRPYRLLGSAMCRLNTSGRWLPPDMKRLPLCRTCFARSAGTVGATWCREQGAVYQGFSLLTANAPVFRHPLPAHRQANDASLAQEFSPSRSLSAAASHGTWTGSTCARISIAAACAEARRNRRAGSDCR